VAVDSEKVQRRADSLLLADMIGDTPLALELLVRYPSWRRERLHCESPALLSLLVTSARRHSRECRSVRGVALVPALVNRGLANLDGEKRPRRVAAWAASWGAMLVWLLTMQFVIAWTMRPIIN
jgi:hypothetical protein